MSDCSNWRGDQIKATVEQEFRERQSEDSGARSVRGRQPERMLRVIAETTERVDVFRTRRVRTCLSLSVNKINPSLHEPTLSASFLPYELCYTGAETRESKPECRCHHVLTNGIAICGCHPVARGTPPRTS